MTTDTRTRAEALLILGRERISAAEIVVRGHDTIAEQIGPGTADWAYADLGTDPGYRRPSESAKALGAWTPTEADWCIVLVGIPGTGKTIAASRYVAERGGLLLQASMADRWGFGGGRFISRYEAARWLLIDDIGTESTKPGIDNIHALLTSRAARCAPTIATTMLPLATPKGTDKPSLTSRYGDHVVSRLRKGYRLLIRHPDERTDLRPTGDAPSLRGYSRTAHLHRAANLVRAVANGGLLGDEAEAAIANLATLLGVDLDGTAFTEAVDARAQELADINAMAEAAVSELEAQIANADGSDPVTDALAWLDALPQLQDHA